MRCRPLVMADGRNFRSFYYDTLGLKNVEQKKALEILLKSEEIDVSRVATFSSRYSLPAVFRSHVWKILLGITPSYQEANSYVSQQRTEQYNDLHQALVTIRQIDPADPADPAEVVTKLFMMQEGLFRLIDIPKDQKRKLEILHAVVKVFVDMFEDHVDLYWLSIKFVGIQEDFISHWDKLVKLIQHYVQAESNVLWKHLHSFNGFEHMPYQRWFESSFAEDLSDSCMERIWDKVVAGSSRILAIVGAALLLVNKHSLMSAKEAESMEKVLNQPCPEERCIIIVNKAMELWDKHGSTITSEAPTSH